MRLVLDEIPARDVAVGDRILRSSRAQTVASIEALRLGSPWPTQDAERVNLRFEPDVAGVRGETLMLRPRDLVFRLVALFAPGTEKPS